jgi:hypothetical protein
LQNPEKTLLTSSLTSTCSFSTALFLVLASASDKPRNAASSKNILIFICFVRRATASLSHCTFDRPFALRVNEVLSGLGPDADGVNAFWFFTRVTSSMKEA